MARLMRELGIVGARRGRSIRTTRPDPAGVRGADLLFQILTKCGTVIPDPRLVAAIVDRLTFNAHIIETGTHSYRLRTTTRRKTA